MGTNTSLIDMAARGNRILSPQVAGATISSYLEGSAIGRRAGRAYLNARSCNYTCAGYLSYYRSDCLANIGRSRIAAHIGRARTFHQALLQRRDDRVVCGGIPSIALAEEV